MKSSFLPGVVHWWPNSSRSPAKLRHRSPGCLPSSEPLPCTTSSWDRGSTKLSVPMYIARKVSSLWCHLRCTGSRAT